jgi:Cu(I)/Ag(I) efflux system membrane fusion protein
MFVRARVRARVAAGGKVMDAALAGKWICPMHPEIVKDDAGTCDLCGMPLVRTESLGYVTAEATETEAPLVIPASAPLITGRRAVVYVAVPGDEGVFEGREVVLGPRAGAYYLVRKGLAEGEMVVVNGNFKIDSAVQILAKPSMMSGPSSAPDTGQPPEADAGQGSTPSQGKAERLEPLEVPDLFKRQLDEVFSAYFEAQQALSRDRLPEASAAAKKLAGALADADMKLLKGPAHNAWMKEQANVGKSANRLAAAANLETARREFALLSESMAAVAGRFGTSGKEPVIRFHCPMAFDNRGADWLQNKPGTENPYFGSAMFKCGKQKEVIVHGPAQK